MQKKEVGGRGGGKIAEHMKSEASDARRAGRVLMLPLVVGRAASVARHQGIQRAE